jgi:hypothetical protein
VKLALAAIGLFDRYTNQPCSTETQSVSPGMCEDGINCRGRLVRLPKSSATSPGSRPSLSNSRPISNDKEWQGSMGETAVRESTIDSSRLTRLFTAVTAGSRICWP